MRTRNAFGGGTIVWLVAAVTLCGSVTMPPAAAAADPQAEGRKHSRRAAQLAAADKCRAAIPEYGKALALLKDAALFFNRGECYRRLQDNERALADYRQFLQEIPDAPNRAQVAARIAELERVMSKAPAAPGDELTTRAPATPAARPVPAPPSPSPAPPPPEASPPSADVAAATAELPKTATGDRAINISPAPKFAEPQIVMVDGDRQHPARDADNSVTGRWWFWTAVGAVLIGGGVATYFIVNSGKTEIPSTGLGNYIVH